jgi:hypothetical protein
MWKQIAIAGATAAIIGGAGTAALAESGSSSPSGAAQATTTASPTASTSPSSTGRAAKAPRKRPGLARLRKLQHGSWVTGDGTSTDVTHDIIRGKVTAISATLVTVKSADNTTQTYSVNTTTKVHTRAKHTGAAITDVKTGDEVTVTGIASGTHLTATQVLDRAK